MKNTSKISTNSPKLSRRTRIFFKSCLIGIGLCIAVPLVYYFGVGAYHIFSFILNCLYDIFINPFLVPFNETGVWGNLLKFLPFVLSFFVLSCFGPFGWIIGAIIVLFGVATQLYGAVFFMILFAPIGVYMIVNQFFNVPILGIIAAFGTILVTIFCWGMMTSFVLNFDSIMQDPKIQFLMKPDTRIYDRL
jgi:hypothetical protein